MRPHRLLPLAVVLALGFGLSSCDRGQPLATPQACAELNKTSGLDPQRLMLAEGYSMLRKDARTLGAVQLLLWVKFESEDFDKQVTAVSKFGSKLREDLDRLAKQYPGVVVDLDPLPVLEKRKRLATGIDKFADIAPVVGKSGPEFERVLMISLTNGLNQERHLVEEMAKEEPDPQLKKFLQQTQVDMDRLYEQSEALLEKSYYRKFSEGGRKG